MCGGNADAVLDALDAVIADLAAARAALDGADPITPLVPWLAPGHTARARRGRAAGASRADLPATGR